MLVFIDESGCPGFKLHKGSTPYFILAMVIFDDSVMAERTSFTIGKLRENLKVKPEFKFNKSSNRIRDTFFQSIMGYEFRVRALVVEKRFVYSSFLRQNKNNCYNFFVRNLMTHDDNCLKNASIKIDGSGNREFQRAMLTYLRNQIGSNKLCKFKAVDSRKDNLIQLADMTVGAIARSYNENRKDNNRWLEMLKLHGKINDIWNFR